MRAVRWILLGVVGCGRDSELTVWTLVELFSGLKRGRTRAGREIELRRALRLLLMPASEVGRFRVAAERAATTPWPWKCPASPVAATAGSVFEAALWIVAGHGSSGPAFEVAARGGVLGHSSDVARQPWRGSRCRRYSMTLLTVVVAVDHGLLT